MLLLIAGKMFTTGRIIFAICFIIAFVFFMVKSYKKDSKNHDIYYKKTYRDVAIAIIITIAALVVSKIIFK